MTSLFITNLGKKLQVVKVVRTKLSPNVTRIEYFVENDPISVNMRDAHALRIHEELKNKYYRR